MQRHRLAAALWETDPNYADAHAAKHFRTALGIAVLLHLLLAIFMPSLPIFNLDWLSRESGLNVYLIRDTPEKSFEQTLNQQLPQPNLQGELVEPRQGAAAIEKGEQALVSESAPEMDSSEFGLDNSEAKPLQEARSASSQPVLRVAQATLQLFAQEEAVRYAQDNPDKVEQFRRSFISQRNYRRRNKVEHYKNLYGDYYVRATTSVGDICFLQEREEVQPDDFSFNIVTFFSCGKKPLKLELGRSD